MTLKAAFMFIAPDADPALHRAVVATPEVEVTTVAVRDYAAAERMAVELVAQGLVAIELCAGFGVEGLARVKRAVNGQAVVGAVRFDCHPGLGFRSGDELFQSVTP
jgi:hypothetical protein